MIKFLLLLLLWLSFAPAWAIETLELRFAQVSGEDWRVEQLALELDIRAPDSHRFGLELSIKRLELSVLKQPLLDITLRCNKIEQRQAQVTCQQGTLKINHAIFAKKPMAITFSYHLITKAIQLTIPQLPFSGGLLKVHFAYTPEQWTVELDAKKIALSQLQQQLNKLFDVTLADYAITQGEMALNLTAQQKKDRLQLNFSGDIHKAHFSNEQGNHLGENVNLAFNSRLIKTDQQWQGDVELNQQGGELFIEPLYMATESRKLQGKFKFIFNKNRLELKNIQLIHPEVLWLNAEMVLKLGQGIEIEQMQGNLNLPNLAWFHQAYLQNWLESLGFQSLMLMGSLNLLFSKKETVDLRLSIANVSIENAEKTYGLDDLNGQLYWQSDPIATVLPSQLYWRSAYFFNNVTLGNSEINFKLNQHELALLRPWYIPILDGAVQINELHLRHLDNLEQLEWQLSSKIWPISMQAFSTALGGPPLKGQFSGHIPAIYYQDKQIEIGGELSIAVFDGKIDIQSMRLIEPFSKTPQLFAHVALERINLGTLTGVFEQFGAVEGEVSGYVKDLHLVNWQPITFDAFISTSENSKVPRRINQKAVNNLSSLGGGGTVNAISRGVLNLFDNFSYERLGLGCRLRSGICEMRGVAAANNGYYIVKGGGLPSINLIGYNQQVDWKVLLERLKRINHIKDIRTPVIE
ncbi:hypothetical protein [Thioflexithrix psekupsensis]|uniref:Dicarboxylate transport domain-containing protein n=1 Tax=Thioflexithrix psekupsensis TaxID=1570016 RepID=A0A251X8G2_9GAMM|nr:hypothetical protein [Thioflexithrix psekupsensis]OUD14261.1 hypothetical protein TPSD3_08010 [Thioflexithrix psekupsensis]